MTVSLPGGRHETPSVNGSPSDQPPPVAEAPLATKPKPPADRRALTIASLSPNGRFSTVPPFGKSASGGGLGNYLTW